MNDLLSKLSSYNLFNNLLPGILFVVLLNYFTEYKIKQDNILLAGFLYYFIGLTISRISSVIIEPLLKKIKFIKFRDYEKFVEAYRKDSKLDVLVETSNKFRVLFTTTLLIISTKFFHFLDLRFLNMNIEVQKYLLIIGISLIYLFAYRKQTKYITKRIDANT